MDVLAEELETVQSIFMEDLTHKEDGSDYTLSFSVEGQLVLTLLLKPGASCYEIDWLIDWLSDWVQSQTENVPSANGWSTRDPVCATSAHIFLLRT